MIGRFSRRLRPTAAGIEAGLTPTRTMVLLHVVRAERIKLAEVAEAEGLNPTMLSRVVAQLADDGLVTRESDEEDRRAAWVSVTTKGKKLAERIRRERTDALNRALHGLTESEQQSIERALPALEKLADALKDRSA